MSKTSSKKSKKQSKKSIETLIEDIYDLFDKGHDVSEKSKTALGINLASVISERLASYKEKRKQTLRMSNIGKNPLQLWYDINGTHEIPETSPQDKFKFLFGDILEALVIFLAKEAGHTVTREQEEVELEGIKGHIDCFIDGELVDVKSTSKYAFGKFLSEKSLRDQDSFGYVEQLSGYAQATGRDSGYFFAVGKEDGRLQLLQLGIDDVRPRIKDLKEILSKSEPPFKCSNDRPIGTSGNRELTYPCTYCNHKEVCWPGLQRYEYSNGIKYLTVVAKEPQVNKKEN